MCHRLPLPPRCYEALQAQLARVHDSARDLPGDAPWPGIDNGLGRDENRRLMISMGLTEIEGLLLRGFSRLTGAAP